MLCRLYYDSGQYGGALREGHKAFTIAENSIDRYPEILAEESIHLKSLTEILNLLKNLSQGPVPGTVAKTSPPSFKLFINLFQSELANPAVLRVYVHILPPLPPLTCYQIDKHDEIIYAIGLVDKLLHHPNMLTLKRKLTECHIDILVRNCKFAEALQLSLDIATMYPNYHNGSITWDYEFTCHTLYLFWSQIYAHRPLEAIDVARKKLGRYQQEWQGQQYVLAIALFDAGEVKEGLSCILAAIDNANDDTKQYHLWLASQLHFAMKNYSEAGRMADEIVDNPITLIRGEFLSIIRCLVELGQILFSGLMFCCSGDHEKGREALSTFERYIEDKISVSGPVVIPVIRLALSTEEKRGKWRLICEAAESVLQCDHMKLVLNGSWAEIAAPHL